MKIAINFHRVGSASRRETAGPTFTLRRKAQRLVSERRPDSGPKKSTVDLKQHKPDRSSFGDAIRLAQQGDAKAFEIIYQQHSGRVYALCLRMLTDPVEAEDLADYRSWSTRLVAGGIG